MTEFASIYDKFLSRIEDYGYLQLLTLEDDSAEKELERILRGFLDSAISRFKGVCRKNLSDVTRTGFAEELDEDEKEILVLLMVAAYIDVNMITEEHMRNFINSRDYRQYSGANLVKQLRETRKLFQHDAEVMMNNYDNYHFKLDWKNKYGK